MSINLIVTELTQLQDVEQRRQQQKQENSGNILSNITFPISILDECLNDPILAQLVASTLYAQQIRNSNKLKNSIKNLWTSPPKCAPSSFVKPTKISKELASFLGKPQGTEMARTEVTREINAYIRAHNLQDPKNGRVIRADSKLRKLLKLNKEDELTYFNLQRYMSPHFAKSAKAKAAAAAAAAAASS